MLTAKIINDGVELELHGEHQHLSSGSIVKAVNAIDTFTFSMLPSNQCFDQVKEFSIFVKVWNDQKKRYDFQGRAFFPTSSMTAEGLLARTVVCEGFLAFLCDSCQQYVAEQEWEAETLLAHILTCHNSQLEEYKHISIGTVNVVGTVTTAIDRENSWDSIQNKLIANLGGEINLRVEEDGLYLDYLQRIGETKETVIALSHNMKAIEQERDPSEYVTRLIPLGQKLEDSEERVTIASVNNGVEYIDDEAAKVEYGIRVSYVEFDEISDPAELKAAGEAWMTENNHIKVKYSITALDLSLLGLDMDDFELYNSHPIRNHLLGIGDTARIIRKTIDVCDQTKSTIEVGENFKTFSDLQREAAKAAQKSNQNTIKSVASLGVTVSNMQKQNALWSGSAVLGEGESIDLSQQITSQNNGIVLAFSLADASAFQLFFVPKSHIAALPGKVIFQLTAADFSLMGTKSLTISGSSITGSAENSSSGESNGMLYDSSGFVLRAVYGV